MAHVERVSVEGFKKIAELSVEPGQFTVVTGRNNSGKTSLLEAVRLGCEPETVREFRATPAPRSESFHSRFGPASYIRHGAPQAVVETTVDDESKRLELRQAAESRARGVVAEIIVDLLERRFNGEESLTEAVQSGQTTLSGLHPTASLQEIATAFLADLDTELSEYVTIVGVGETEHPLVGRPDAFSRLLYQFIRVELVGRLDRDELERLGIEHSDSGTGSLTTASNLTRRLDTFPNGVPDARLPTKFVTHGTTVDADDDDPVKTDDIGDFLREKEILEDLKTFTLDDLIFDPDDGEKYAVPFDQMGDGFRAIVALLWELLDDDLPEVVFLEEPTTHMHPGYVREVVYFLVQLAMEEDVQLFVTTHSNDFLNDLFAENLREEEVAFLEEEFKLFQMQDGGAKTLDYREAEHSLEELMLDLRGL